MSIGACRLVAYLTECAADTPALRTREHRRLPAVLTVEETQRVLGQLGGVYPLIGLLLYDSKLPRSPSW